MQMNILRILCFGPTDSSSKNFIHIYCESCISTKIRTKLYIYSYSFSLHIVVTGLLKPNLHVYINRPNRLFERVLCDPDSHMRDQISIKYYVALLSVIYMELLHSTARLYI